MSLTYEMWVVAGFVVLALAVGYLVLRDWILAGDHISAWRATSIWQRLALVLAILYGAVVLVPPPYFPFPFRYQFERALVKDTWTGRIWIKRDGGFQEFVVR